jgi:hypothetical protein
MTSKHYQQLEDGPIDHIDAAIWTGDIFHNQENIQAFRNMMSRWEQGLKECEDIINESSNND